jgi:hypothetical protein
LEPYFLYLPSLSGNERGRFIEKDAKEKENRWISGIKIFFGNDQDN